MNDVSPAIAARMSEMAAEILALRARLAEVEAERDKALNQARHWREQEAKQRRLHHEQGRWKHRALAAELTAAHMVRPCDCATPGNCDGCHCWRP